MYERVLVVDDDPIVRRAYTMTLLRAKFHVVEAGSFEETLHVLRRPLAPIDVAVVDYTLPDRNGEEVARVIRSEVPRAAIILITGDRGAPAGGCFVRLHLHAFLEKPISGRKLIAQIKTARNVVKERVAALDRDRAILAAEAQPKIVLGTPNELASIESGAIGRIAVVDEPGDDATIAACDLGVHAIVTRTADEATRLEARAAAEIAVLRDAVLREPARRRELLSPSTSSALRELAALTGLDSLPPRMREYCVARFRGERVASIAERSAVSVRSVKRACEEARRRLGVSNLAELWDVAAQRVDAWWASRGGSATQGPRQGPWAEEDLRPFVLRMKRLDQWRGGRAIGWETLRWASGAEFRCAIQPRAELPT